MASDEAALDAALADLTSVSLDAVPAAGAGAPAGAPAGGAAGGAGDAPEGDSLDNLLQDLASQVAANTSLRSSATVGSGRHQPSESGSQRLNPVDQLEELLGSLEGTTSRTASPAAGLGSARSFRTDSPASLQPPPPVPEEHADAAGAAEPAPEPVAATTAVAAEGPADLPEMPLQAPPPVPKQDLPDLPEVPLQAPPPVPKEHALPPLPTSPLPASPSMPKQDLPGLPEVPLQAPPPVPKQDLPGLPEVPLQAPPPVPKEHALPPLPTSPLPVSPTMAKRSSFPTDAIPPEELPGPAEGSKRPLSKALSNLVRRSSGRSSVDGEFKDSREGTPVPGFDSGMLSPLPEEDEENLSRMRQGSGAGQEFLAEANSAMLVDDGYGMLEEGPDMLEASVSRASFLQPCEAAVIAGSPSPPPAGDPTSPRGGSMREGNPSKQEKLATFFRSLPSKRVGNAVNAAVSTSLRLTRRGATTKDFNFTTTEEDESLEFEFDTGKMELLIRGCKGQLALAEHRELTAFLLSLPDADVQRYHRTAHRILHERAMKLISIKSRHFRSDEFDLPSLELSRYRVDFGLTRAECPLDTLMRDEIDIHNNGKHKAKFKFVTPQRSGSFMLRVEPSEGVIRKKSSMTVVAELRMRTTLHLKTVIVIETEGGFRSYITVNIKSELSMFGVLYNTLDLVDDLGYRVPAVLATMRKYLVDNNGYEQEGIFRLAGDESETQRVKEMLNKTGLQGQPDVSCVATLIKVWFREYPEPMLNTIESSVFLQCATEDECGKVLEEMADPFKTLLLWLIDVIIDVAARESVNKMSAKNLAIVVAPNLYQTPPDANPFESLTLSQKVVAFFHNLVEYRLAQRGSAD